MCCGKLPKDLITVFVCANSDGTEKIKFLLLGNQKALDVSRM
jgi:hypothetical protein